MFTLRQDGREASGRRTRSRKERGEPASAEDRDRFLLTVSTLARLDRVSAAEFEMLCEHGIPPANGKRKR